MKKVATLFFASLVLASCGSEEEEVSPGDEVVTINDQEESEEGNHQEQTEEEQSGPREVDISLVNRDTLTERAEEEQKAIEDMNEELSGENIEDSFDLYDDEEVSDIIEDGETDEDAVEEEEESDETTEDENGEDETTEPVGVMEQEERVSFMDSVIAKHGEVDLNGFVDNPEESSTVANNVIAMSEELFPVYQGEKDFSDIDNDTKERYLSFVNKHMVNVNDEVDIQGLEDMIQDNPASILLMANVNLEENRLSNNINEEDTSTPVHMFQSSNDSLYRMFFQDDGNHIKYRLAQGI